jgi:hypothetical protein
MAKLATIDLPAADAQKSPVNIPVIPVKGDVVTRYTEAADTSKNANEVMARLKPALLDAGVEAVFAHNIAHGAEPKEQISTVKLLDEKTGEALLCSWSVKNMKNDPKQVEAEFKTLRQTDGRKANINDYVAEVPVASFDSSVFIVNGEFSMARYADFMRSLEAVAAAHGVANPLSCAKILQPRADFHVRRWTAFDADANLALQAVLPTQVTLKPVRPA